MPIKCSSGGKPARAARLPAPAPTRPPALHAPCRDDMMGRDTRACTSTASTFIATCMVPSAAPISSITSTSDGTMPIRNGIGNISNSTTPASSAS